MANYENMRDSGVKWIGYAPSHWEIKFLHQVVSYVKNKNLDLAEKNLLSLSYGKIKRKDINTNEGLLPLSFENYNVIKKGDIVLRLTDLQNDHTSLRVGRAEEKGIITSAYTTLRPFDINYSKYLYYLLHSFDIKKGFYGMGSGVRQGLGYDELKNSLVLVPPLPEQAAIANYLDKVCAQIDDIIEETKKSAEDYKKLRLSVISEAVTCGLDKNAEMKDSGVEWIGKVPKGWKITRIKNVIKIENGSDPKTEGKIPVYGSGSESFKTCGEYKEGPTVLLGRKGATLHIPHYIEGRYWNVDTAFNTIVINDLIDLKYFYYLSFCFDYNSYMSQTTLPSMTQSNYSAMNIPYPPMNEQKAIAEYLDKKCAAIDEIIAEKENLITDLESYKKSLIYETVTGKRKAV